jgi:hypothetical protein
MSRNRAPGVMARDATGQGIPLLGVLILDFNEDSHLSVCFGYVEVKQAVLPWWSSCRDEVMVTHFRVGHSRLTHNSLLARNPPPCLLPVMCNSVSHILGDYPRYSFRHERFCMYSTISYMLGSDPDSLIQVSAFYELVRSFAFYNSVT